MTHDLVVVGSGFASAFFLHRYLEKAPASARVLVLERGPMISHAWQVQHQKNSDVDARESIQLRGDPDKEWVFNIGFGGSSNCWWACTPRLLPEDFRLSSKYAIGRDWPISYDELEEYYCLTEEIMSVSGSPESETLFPRSRPYPQPPHRLTNPDSLLRKRFPGLYYPQPTARARVRTEKRSACCANAVCNICPVNAKFTIQNGMSHVFDDPRVEVRTEATVEHLGIRNDVAESVEFRQAEKRQSVRADLVAVGANAIFNPFLLQSSGLTHPLLGRRLHEQVAVNAIIDLDGVDNFQGSTSITGQGYMMYGGPHRAERAGCLIEGWNQPFFRFETGKWRQVLRLKFLFEDLPEEQNRVEVDATNPGIPAVHFEGRSQYALRGIEALEPQLTKILEGLPVERFTIDPELSGSEAHNLGTTVFGGSPEDSVVDRHLIHHQVRNLLVLGGSVFPTGPPANPTLTISALSLWAADHL